jgi:LmeA-like phospholipid-binding
VTEPTAPLPYDWDQSKRDDVPTAKKPKRRRRRRTKWLIALVVLLGLLVAADRIALVVAEGQLASRIQSSQHLSQKPDVSIDGFPFLTQVISRDFPHATVDIHGLTANDGLVISDLHADLHGVHVNSGFNSATVDTLAATAQMSYADIAKALASQLTVGGVQVGEVKLSDAGNDQLTAAYSVLGVGISATIDVTVVGTNTLRFKSVSIKTPVSALFTPPNFDVSYNLGALPFGMDLTQLTFTPSAVEISATGRNVDLSQSAVSNR